DHKNGEQNAAEGDALRDGAHEIAPRLLEGGPDDVLAGVVGHERLRLVKIDPNRAEADAILQPAKPALVQLDLRSHSGPLARRLLEGGPDAVLAGVVGHEGLRLVKIDPHRAEADAILQPAKPALVQLDLRSHSGQFPFRLHDIGEFSGAALKQRDKALLEPS